jgi:fructose/tagatose bisphosphate aldolase
MSKVIFDVLTALVNNSISVSDGKVQITDEKKFRANIEKLVKAGVTGSGKKQLLARYLVRCAALELGIVPASIHELYTARGAGKVPNTFTVPAINLRVLSYDAARMVFRAAKKINAGAFIFEIARSEMGYTDQRPSEYTANVLGAAIKEGYSGPVFIQGDHFQVSLSKFQTDPKGELQAVKDLTIEAIEAGYFNIDVDTSTLVDLSKSTIPEQQTLNTTLSAEMTKFIRELQPEGVMISVGGEIGEVGGHNSTEEELRAYIDGYRTELKKISPKATGLSKISIQTGTSHGGVVLPDGSIAKVSVDFDTLLHLSQIAREYGMGGAVQHGASTLPQEAFSKFVEAEAVEVHLATNFQNIFFDIVPDDLKNEMYAYLDKNHANERKEGMTDDQFYYKARKRAVGPYKKQTWELSDAYKEKICEAWEAQFDHLFDQLSIGDTQKYVQQTIKAPKIMPNLDDYLKRATGDSDTEDTSDMAD